MPFLVVRNDITKMKVDAVVNAANRSLMGGGGVDGAIHAAAGYELYEACAKLGGCEVGKAKVTPGFQLPARYIIHTVGPIWNGGSYSERELLAECYENSLKLALEYGCETVAFPLISAGAYGFPKKLAVDIAVRTITSFIEFHELTVYLVVFDKKAFEISSQLFDDISSYIDDQYIENDYPFPENARHRPDFDGYSMPYPGAVYPTQSVPSLDAAKAEPKSRKRFSLLRSEKKEAPTDASAFEESSVLFNADEDEKTLDDLLRVVDESFSEMLLRKIDEKGMSDSACYKKANIDRKLFSKIRSNKDYKPSKQTAIAFAVALELPLEETKELLMKAGFALSHSNKSDIIIEYFIKKGNYNIFDINDALFAFDQVLLGVG